MSHSLSKELLHFLDRFSFSPRIKSNYLLAGRHKSALFGESPEFREFRNYSTDDSTHLIDWRASAKNKVPLIRKREHEGQLKNWLILDGSASMLYPSETSSKYRRQLFLAAALMHLLSSESDSVGVILVKNTQPALKLVPTRTREGLARAIEQLANYEPKGQAKSMNAQVLELGQSLRHPAVIWLLSDFDEKPDETLNSLTKLRQQGHDVRVLFLFHPDEQSLPWKGECKLTDLEGVLPECSIQPEDLAKAYQDHYKRHKEQIANSLKKADIPLHFLDIKQSVEDNLVDFLSPQVSINTKQPS